MAADLKYESLEKITLKAPVGRIAYIKDQAKGRRVLDLGCYDETALYKVGTGGWLHQELSETADYVIGIDNSARIPQEGIRIGEKGAILKGDICNIDDGILKKYDFDLIVAGEVIEHLPNALDFFKDIKLKFAGKEFIASTPNALSMGNFLAGIIKREATDRNHLQAYTYKILNTLCSRSGFADWEIIPYHIYFTDMITKAKGARKGLMRAAESCTKCLESIFPLLSGGLILHVKKI